VVAVLSLAEWSEEKVRWKQLASATRSRWVGSGPGLIRVQAIRVDDYGVSLRLTVKRQQFSFYCRSREIAASDLLELISSIHSFRRVFYVDCANILRPFVVRVDLVLLNSANPSLRFLSSTDYLWRGILGALMGIHFC